MTTSPAESVGDDALLDIIEEAITVDWLIQDARCVDPVAA